MTKPKDGEGAEALSAAVAEVEAVRAVWADIKAPGGFRRLIERATNQKDRLRRCEDGGYTVERTKQECGAAAFVISQLTTALAEALSPPATPVRGGGNQSSSVAGLPSSQEGSDTQDIRQAGKED